MDARPLTITSVYWFLIVTSGCGAHTVHPATKSSSNGSVVNKHAEQSACERYGMTLKCHVPALDDNIDFRNYTGNIVLLNLYCDKKRYLPSRLLDGLFAPLGQNLTDIYICGCFIIGISRHAFGGLGILQSLWIEGGSYPEMDNSWLEISSVSNSTLPSETKLSLRSTTWYHDNLVLPEGVFSELHNLVDLKMTAMRLNSSVWHAVKHLRNLQYLNLSNNKISSVGTGIFSWLSQLVTLDLSQNNIRSVGTGILQGLSHMRTLDLSQNNIRSVGTGILQGLSHMRTLDLSQNNIRSVGTGTFKGLSQLVTLHLSQNNISSVGTGTFKGLSQLVTLDLSQNNISSVGTGTFKGLSQLVTLDLSQNNISSVGTGTFSWLSQLVTLDLSQNNIRSVGTGILQGLSHMRTLDLSQNNISSVGTGTFKGLSQLFKLDLSQNTISSIGTGTFKELSQLFKLDLSQNNISSIGTGTFKGLSLMRALNLSENKISTLEMDTSEGLSNLNYLYLAKNRVRILSSLSLSRLTSLRQLDLSCNLIETIPKFPISLISLNLRNNSILGIDKSSFAGLQRLIHLDLSYNKISEYTQYYIPYTMRQWNVSSNELSVASLNMTTELVFADFRNNKLKTLTINGLKDNLYARGPAHIYLAGNGDPFRCTRNIELSKNKSTFIYDRANVARYHSWNFTSLNCMSVSENTCESEITEISARKFVCNTTCYDKCICYHWKYREDNINIVDCLGAGLTAVPGNISVSCTILDLSGNMFPSLGPDNFDSLSQLVELYLNSSNITEIRKGTFKELSNLRMLDLSNNGISILNAGIFTGLSRLSSLDLSFNSLHVVVESTFKYFDRLNNLNFAENELETISSSVIESMYTIKSLQLSNNPWSCDCEFLNTFKPFTTENAKNIKDYMDILCLTSNKTEHNLFQIDLAKFCPQNDKTVYIVITDRTGYIIAGVLVFIIIVFGILFKNREFIKILCYITWDWRRGNNEMDRPYDAFISYSSDDNAFIVRELMPRLEEPGHNRPAYQLCVHFRDFPVGACIANTILAAINRSKRVIIILSNNFLNSAWCHYEFQAAHYQLIEEKKSRIIMVLLHEIDTSLLDNKLKLYLRTRTYVKFGDPLFWNKIEYAMPKLEGVDENPAADDVRLIP